MRALGKETRVAVRAERKAAGGHRPQKRRGWRRSEAGGRECNTGLKARLPLHTPLKKQREGVMSPERGSQHSARWAGG